jgi:periplasmic protein TonB
MSYIQERSTFRLTSGLIAVLFVHAGLLLALKSGLVPHLMEPKPEGFTVVNVPLPPVEPPPQPQVPAPNPQYLGPEIVDLPPPAQVPIEMPVDSPPVDPWSLAPADGMGPVAPPPMVTQPRVDPRYPLTRPDYPASAIRLGKLGTVTLLLYVLPSGQVGEAKVSRSSGYTPLDIAAIREAQRAWRFLPATSDGTPIGGWITYSVTFELTN